MIIKDFSIDLHVLSIFMASIEKGFNEVFDYVKNLEEVKEVSQNKALDKMFKNEGNFSSSYCKGHNQ